MIKFNQTRIIPLNPAQGRYMNDNILQNIIRKFATKAENKISDNSFYAPISDSFIANTKDYKAIALQLSQDEDKFSGHMLELCVLHPNKNLEYKRPLAYGNKETIINYLHDKNVLKNIKKDFEAILNEIKQQN